MTLADVAAERVRLVVVCLTCRHQIEPDLASWLSATGPKPPSPPGTRGFSAANAAAGRSTSPLAKRDDHEVQDAGNARGLCF